MRKADKCDAVGVRAGYLPAEPGRMATTQDISGPFSIAGRWVARDQLPGPLAKLICYLPVRSDDEFRLASRKPPSWTRACYWLQASRFPFIASFRLHTALAAPINRTYYHGGPPNTRIRQNPARADVGCCTVTNPPERAFLSISCRSTLATPHRSACGQVVLTSCLCSGFAGLRSTWRL